MVAAKYQIPVVLAEQKHVHLPERIAIYGEHNDSDVECTLFLSTTRQYFHIFESWNTPHYALWMVS